MHCKCSCISNAYGLRHRRNKRLKHRLLPHIGGGYRSLRPECSQLCGQDWGSACRGVGFGMQRTRTCTAIVTAFSADLMTPPALRQTPCGQTGKHIFPLRWISWRYQARLRDTRKRQSIGVFADRPGSHRRRAAARGRPASGQPLTTDSRAGSGTPGPVRPPVL